MSLPAWQDAKDNTRPENPEPEPQAGIRPAGFQPQPPLLPPLELQTPIPPPRGASQSRLGGPEQAAGRMFGEVIGPALAGGRQPFGAGGANVDVISGLEAGPRVTTDAGNLLGKSPASLGTGVQRRTPIVTDPRVRGSRVGQLAASGSYWVPARIDLDTMLSKIDSRIVDRMVVVNGPYSALYGPGFNWIDVELLPSPRYEGGFEAHGSTSVDYKVNGQQWYGRQSLWAGNDNWGARFGYGHRTGNDYFTGEATFMPASYKSRDMDLAVGFDLSPDSQIEFNGLRLDQTDVQYMGMAFDMDYLVTDGYEVRYVLKNQQRFDQLEFESWYNRTRFAGNAQSPAKRKQFPIFDFFDYVGFTNVDSFSSGFRLDASWGRDDDPRLTLGIDLRYLAQELDEIGSGHSGFVTFTNANSPLPRSNWVNPGVFAEQTTPVGERLKLTAGGRVDFGESRVIDDPAKLAHLGNEPPALQSSLADILGTSDFDQNFWLWSLYLTGDYELTPEWHLLAGTGYGQRPPSLTELYVAQSFMFVLQNGANTLTGDPLLRPEKLLQADLGLACKYDDFRGSVRGFYGWGFDYITFENLRVFHGPPVGAVVQESLKYVNTELATLAGFEMLGEYDVHPWWTPFANVKYVEGTDRTRNGDFATIRAEPGVPSTRDPTKPRGYYSGVAGAAVEPLPSILPLESRLGIRLHAPDEKRRWTVEFSARVVAAQDRVAVSLLETPTPGFTVYDLRGYWRPNDRWLLVGGVENLTNKNYREHLDFRSADFVMFQPGVNFYFGSELTY